jgi:hypothetical protein
VPLPPVTFPTLGWQVIDWIEAYLCHGPGDVQGDDLVIDDEEALFICWAYRLWPRDHKLAGRRMVHRAIYSRPKGRRKSEIAGAIDCAEALGPVRFDGWDANGDPVGRPVTYPFIRCLATEEEQTGNTYDNVVFMLTEGAAADAYAIDPGLTRTFIKEPGGGEIVPSTSGAASKDGGKETKATADETHLYTSRELRTMYRTVARNTGKRKIAEPWMLDTTTMYLPGERSIAEQAAERYGSMPVEEAVTKHGVLYDHRQGDEPKRFRDDRSLIKALKTGYGPAAGWIDFDRIVKVIRDAEDPQAEAYRYYLNRPWAGSRQWLAPDALKRVLEHFDVAPGSKVAVGFDGSQNDDHTALWLCTQAGDLVPVGVWAPRDASVEWRAEVTAAVDWLFSEFDVVRFYGDPPYWIDEMAAWAAKHGKVVREFWTNRDAPMGVACGALRTAIQQAATRIRLEPLRTDPLFVVNDEITTGPAGTPLVQWHFQNARTRKVRVKLEDRAEEAHVVRKERPGSPLKIDSVPAAALAKQAQLHALKEGEFDEPTYDRAQWSGGQSSGGKRRTSRDGYLPCRDCGKEIHPKLHAPDAPEGGRCLKCRGRRGEVSSAKW